MGLGKHFSHRLTWGHSLGHSHHLIFLYILKWIQFSSVQFSRSVVSDSLWPHELQHARPPCPSPTPGVHSDSTSIESVMPSSHFILCRPLLLLPPVPPSIKVFSSESTLCMRWPKYLFHICYWWSTGNQIVVLEEYSWDGSATYDM